MVLIDTLSAMINDKNWLLFKEGLADGNERVVKRTSCALSSSTTYNANGLLEFFKNPEVSKLALIEILRVNKGDLSVHESLRRDLLKYCKLDTSAIMRTVMYFHERPSSPYG